MFNKKHLYDSRIKYIFPLQGKNINELVELAQWCINNIKQPKLIFGLSKGFANKYHS